MTRINTNVGSLIAQNTLARNNDQLQTALTRLSTGLRINRGKDDPAGLIASESLRSDITSIQRAVSNTERANQVIATADSALGQVSKLLNDIKGLVVEAANTGALSEDQIAANQVQVDSSLEAINRIAQTTTFQGRRLLDGSLDFISTLGNVASVSDFRIDQATLGASGVAAIDVDITSAATRAQITNAAPASTNAAATAKLVFAAEANLTGFTDANTDITVRATEAGTPLEGVTVQFQADGTAVGAEVATYDADANTITVQINNAAATTAANVTTAINSLVEFDAVNNGGAGDVINGSLVLDRGINDVTDADEVDITATQVGPDFNDVAVSVVSSSGVAAGAPTAVYSPDQKSLVITINDAGTTTVAQVATAIGNLAEFSAVGTGNGDGLVRGDFADSEAVANTDTTGGGVLLDDLVLQISGLSGTEVFRFQSGASVNQIEAAIDLVSDATGVTASQSNGTITFQASAYGSKGFVDVEVVSEGNAGTFQDGLSAFRASGTDIAAIVNGIQASGEGNTLAVNTSTLDLSITVDEGSTTNFNFDITGGGALFQLGPDVVSNQQARLGIANLNTASLGGSTGRLYELASGGAKALAADPTGAASVVDDVINVVTTLRGRLGAFQRTTLDTNVASLNDTLANLTEAESSIRDADFAVESSNLTRAQILSQSGLSVLGIANQSPQNVLSLLR